MLQHDQKMTHVTEVVGVLLGQDNSRKVNNTGEFHTAWVLAVEPLIENVHGVPSFNDIHGVLR